MVQVFFSIYFHLFRSCWHTFMHMISHVRCSMFALHCIQWIFSLLTYIWSCLKRKQLLAPGYIIFIIFTRIFLSHSALLKLELMISFKQNEWINEWINEWHIEKKNKSNEMKRMNEEDGEYCQGEIFCATGVF